MPGLPECKRATRIRSGRDQKNLVAQLTASVRWTQTVQNMLADGASSFLEIGPGNVLQGLIKKVSTEVETAECSRFCLKQNLLVKLQVSKLQVHESYISRTA